MTALNRRGSRFGRSTNTDCIVLTALLLVLLLVLLRMHGFEVNSICWFEAMTCYAIYDIPGVFVTTRENLS